MKAIKVLLVALQHIVWRASKTKRAHGLPSSGSRRHGELKHEHGSTDKCCFGFYYSLVIPIYTCQACALVWYPPDQNNIV